MEETRKLRMRQRAEKWREQAERAERWRREPQKAQERIEKNKEWKKKREEALRNAADQGEGVQGDQGDVVGGVVLGLAERSLDKDNFAPLSSLSGGRKCVEWIVRQQIRCILCHSEMGQPGKIYQCLEGHCICQPCRYSKKPDQVTCPICGESQWGRNCAGENLAALLHMHHPARAFSSVLEPAPSWTDDQEGPPSSWPTLDNLDGSKK